MKQVRTFFILLGWFALAGCGDARPERPAEPATGRVDSLVEFQKALGPDILATLTDAERALLKDKLCNAGRYECCIEPGCDMCIERTGSCECYTNLKKQEKICRECYVGYRKGRGRIKTVDLTKLKKIQDG
jgi:hypothetical protein